MPPLHGIEWCEIYTMEWCIFHLLQSVWRWLCDSSHNINKQHRQTLMGLVRKLVYTQAPADAEYEYTFFKGHPLVTTYKHFMKYIESYWSRKEEWCIAYRSCVPMRGNTTNNFSETGIRILKDIVFRRIKAYNLIQVFDFITIIFESYYKARLLAIAHNRLDRYIALRFKGFGTERIKDSDIQPSPNDDKLYTVKSQVYPDAEYTVDIGKGFCTCSLGFNGQPTGEPCRHQAAVAKKYKLPALNVIPTFSADGRYLFAKIAVGNAVGPISFYAGLHDDTPSSSVAKQDTEEPKMQETEMDTFESTENIYDDSLDNLDLLLSTMDKMETEQAKLLKLNSQVVNVTHPNSIHNTCLLAVFKAGDTTATSTHPWTNTRNM